MQTQLHFPSLSIASIRTIRTWLLSPASGSRTVMFDAMAFRAGRARTTGAQSETSGRYEPGNCAQKNCRHEGGEILAWLVCLARSPLWRRTVTPGLARD